MLSELLQPMSLTDQISKSKELSEQLCCRKTWSWWRWSSWGQHGPFGEFTPLSTRQAVKHLGLPAKKKHAIIAEPQPIIFQWVNLSDHRFLLDFLLWMSKAVLFTCLLVFALTHCSLDTVCPSILGQGLQEKSKIIFVSTLTILPVLHLWTETTMPPSRHVHASAPVDKYLPSNSLVIGMNIFLSNFSRLQFSPYLFSTLP